MSYDFLKQAYELSSEGQPFAIAIVVRSERPTSARPGAKAVIKADGTLSGWVGGGCAQPVVVKEALEALKDGNPRFLRLSPGAEPESEEGILEFPMTCQSSGALDIYIEPVLPKPQILIIGQSLVARTLTSLGKLLNYAICVAAPGADKERFPEADLVLDELDLSRAKITQQTYIVVATQGEYDEEALEQAIGTGASYIAFVASKKKAKLIWQYLEEKGIAAESLQRVKVPAGLDIGAASPEEIAVSIMAEIIRVRRSAAKAFALEEVLEAAAKESKDPICGMLVDVGKARYKSDHRGKTFYFCSLHCKQAFDKEPERYAVAANL